MAIMESTVLESFIRSSLAPPDLRAAFGERPSYAQRAVYFLLDLAFPPGVAAPEPSQLRGVEPFVQHSLTRLLHQLNRRSERMQETYHGQVHGQVLWEATYKARYSEEFNPSIYVCARMRHCYDTPENQLLKYLIERIEDCLKAVPPEIEHGWCFLPRTGERLTERISARLENLYTLLGQLRRSARLREINAPLEVNERMLQLARQARSPEYGLAAGLYDQYQAAVLQPGWERLAEIARRVRILPGGELTPASQAWIELAAALAQL